MAPTGAGWRCHLAGSGSIRCCQAARYRVGRPAAGATARPRRPHFGTRARALSISLSLSRVLYRHDVGAQARRPAADSPTIRHGSSSMFARESDAVSPRLGRCTILVCAAGTSRVTRRANRELGRPLDVVAIGARSCASQWCVGQPRLVYLGVAWRHRSSRSNSNSGGGGGDNLNSEQLLRGVRVRGPCGSRSRLRRELARRSARRCVSAVAATATAAAATAARAARTR